ncbi:MAG: ABC transporter ATP-binding protein [Burkholderiaceae bacterium]
MTRADDPSDAVPSAQPVALQAQGLSARLGGVQVLHPTDVSLRAARWTAVVGPNGAGKSTLLEALAGLLPHAGTVRWNGRDREALGRRERARMLAWLGQGGAGGAGSSVASGAGGSADDLSVHDIALLGRLPHRGWLAPPTAADLAAAEQALRQVQAWDWRERALGQLSGGERQRVLLARCLAVQAPLMLMDEPLANLDPPHQADWMALARAHAAAGGTVVSVLHEVGIALQADDLLVLRDGRVIHHGPCADAATHDALQTAFDHRLSIHRVDGRWTALPRA